MFMLYILIFINIVGAQCHSKLNEIETMKLIGIKSFFIRCKAILVQCFT